jgi:ribosomal silencing factor RsfS
MNQPANHITILDFKKTSVTTDYVVIRVKNEEAIIYCIDPPSS